MIQYTFNNNAEAERKIAADQAVVTNVVANNLSGAGLEAIALIGGYGRREGGYVIDNGKHKPHNDYDYFLIFKGLNRFECDKAIAGLPDLSTRLGIEVDFAPLRCENLEKLPYSLMHAEMLASPTIIWGNKSVLKPCPGMPLSGVPLAEFTRLMINRGCLLLSNILKPNNPEFSKYINKAMLACGDTELAMMNIYDYSYQTKLVKIRELKPNSSLLLNQYERAIGARFRADLASVLTARDLKIAIQLWLSTFLKLEQLRLGQSIQSWELYSACQQNKGQSSGSWLKHLALNLYDRRLTSMQSWLFKHPRERIVSALPVLLAQRQCSLGANNALALPAQCNWHDSAQRLLKLWSSYS